MKNLNSASHRESEGQQPPVPKPLRKKEMVDERAGQYEKQHEINVTDSQLFQPQERQVSEP